MNSKFLLQLKLAAFVWLFVCMAFVQKSLGQITHTTIPLTPTTAPYGSEGVIYVLQVSETNAFPFPYGLNSLSITVNSTVSISLESTYKAYLSNDNLFDNTDTQLSQVQSLTIPGNNTIDFSLTGVSVDLLSPKYLIFTGRFTPPLPTEGGKKNALAVSLGTIKINGATNPVLATYSSIFFPPDFPIGITNNQTDTPGLTLDPDVSTVTGGTPILPPTTLVANYSFCGNANDITANAHNGTAYGVTAAEDRHGNAASAYSFDGQDDVIDLGNWFTLQNFTISMWLKSGSTQGAYANIIDNNHSGSSQNWVCQQDNTTLNSYGFGTMSTGSFFTLTANQWQQLVLVKSPTALETYVNGELIQSTPYSNGPINYTNQYLRLGNWGGGGRHWNGVMDDVKIYDGALTASEISAKYAEENTPTTLNCVTPPPVLVANYSFCDNANDTSPNANHGTVYGATLTTDRFNNINSAYSFDGNDYIEVPNNPALQLGTGDYSIGYWFKTNSNVGPLATVAKNDGNAGYTGLISYLNYPNAGNVLARSVANQELNTNIGATLYNDNNWHYVVYTRQGATQKLYVDNVFKATRDEFLTNISNNKPLTFGVFNDGYQQFMIGQLDDIKIYSGALSEAEIAAEFNAPSTSGCTPVVCPLITVSVLTNTQNACDCTATFEATGGMANYTYSITEGMGGSFTGNSLIGKAGTYTVMATDANGCTGTVSVTLTNNDTEAPTFTNCPADITLTADANCTKVVTWPALEVNENCLGTDPAGFTKLGIFNGHTYYYKSGYPSWLDAKNEAENMGGRLLEINSAEEQNFITSLGKKSFLGINDNATEGQFVYNSGGNISYSNWRVNEPDGGTSENIVLLREDGKWETYPSYIGEPYIMEMDFGYTITQTAGLASGATFPIGTTTNIFEVADAAGNKSTCSFTVTINPSVTASISYPQNSVCKNGTNPHVTVEGAQNGVFSSTTGVVFDGATGNIILAQSPVGTHHIVYTVASSGTCPEIVASFDIEIKALPVVSCPADIAICKNSPIFDLPTFPSGATVTVGGLVNTDGKFDPSADWSAYYDEHGNANVPVVYTITEGGCTASCTYTILVKRLPASNSTVVPEVKGQINGQTVNICKNSTEVVNILFGGSFGSMAPITFSYTLNGVPQPDLVTNAAVGGLPISTATAGNFVYHLTKVKINTGCESEFDVTATVNIIDLPITTLSGGASYCQGENTATTLTITSSASGTISGTLSDGTTFSGTSPIAVIVTPSLTTTYIIASLSTGLCNGNNSGSATVTIKNLPNDNTGMYFIDGNNFGVQTYTICQNSPNVTLRFDQGIGNTGPFIFYYTLNNGPEQSTSSNGNSDFSLPTTTTGQSVYKLTRVSANGCERNFDITATLNVNPIINVSIFGSGTYCEGENTATDLIITSSVAGTISGTLSDGSTFSGTSPITITKSPSQTTTYTIATLNGVACPGTISGAATIVVNEKPVVTCPLDMSVCVSANSFSPMVSPTGGNFSGDGIDDNVFNPALAGVGIHEITYSYTDENTGCTNICTFNITVTNTSTATLTYPATSVCKSETNFAATLVGTGGTFNVMPSTGLTIASNGNINPSTSTPGIYTVKYTIPASGDCAAVEAIATVEIKAIPEVVCPENMSVCINQLSFELGTDGTYSGDGVENNMFNPQTAGLGNHEITLSKTVDGCTSTCTFVIGVSAPPQITINPGSGLSTCEGGNNYVSIFGVGGYTGYSIEYNINGGNTQTASTGDGFITIPIPFNTAGEYIVTITKVDNGSGCPNVTPQGITVTIKAKPVAPTCPANMTATNTDAAFALTGASPGGGLFSGTGVSAGTFNPATAGVGVHIITYTITGENGCQNTCSFTISVTEIEPCNVTLGSFTAESVCQPLPIPLTFTGLVPNTSNDITLGVKEVLIPANAYTDRVVTVTSDASGNASATLDVSGYQTVEYQLTVKEVKIGDCILNPVNITANFNKKPRGGGQTLDILETAICSEASLNGLIGTVPNQFLTNFSFEIRNTSTNAIVQSGTGVAAPNAGNTLTFSVTTVALPAGNYQFRLSNQEIDGCGTTNILTDNFTVSPVPTLTATALITNLDCNNSAAMGAIDLTVLGGSGTYKYAWGNGATSEDLSSLASGTYTVTITDLASCGSPSLVKTFEVSKPAAIVVNIGSLTTACNGNNGTAVLSATGGNGGYIFSSSLGGTVSGSDFSAEVGTYTITATDSKGCTGTATINITECTPSEVICTNTQTDYGNANQTVCNETGSQVAIGSIISAALSGSPYVFGIPANNRTFTLSPADLTTNVYSMLAGVSNASSKFGLGGASYTNTSTWSRVPLTNTGKIANNLFAHSMSLYFNLQNSIKLNNVPLASPILHTESTLACGSDTPSGVVSSYQLPTGVISFLNGGNGYPATVAGLYHLNNDALGGKTGLPNLSTLAAAADKVNKAFKGCKLIAGQPANTLTFGTNIRVNEGGNGFDAPARGGLYMTLIEGDPATGHILGVVEVGSNGLSGFAPVITNSYHVVMGTDPEGSRSPQAPAGYRIVSQIVGGLGNLIAGPSAQAGTGMVEIGIFNPSASAKIAAGDAYTIEFTLEPVGALPVRLVSFTGKNTPVGNELNWKTTSEVNFSHFEVERSTDALSFVKIGKVDGNKGENYEFIDNSSFNSPIGGRGAYYRLKMVDLDGKSDYSKVIFLKNEKLDHINVYPNPAVEYIFVENTDGKLLKIRILDAVGKEVSLLNNMSDSLIKVPVSGISSGAYFLQINDGGKLHYKKVVVNK